jgi:nicotinate-nucleotide adenylyltransferase
MTMERWGIVGGTFDPVHIAHVGIACEARVQCNLDRVLLVVARDPWQKHGVVVASAADRYDMVSAAVAEVDGVEASRLELDRDGPTYTIDTVQELAAPGRELVLVVGADVAASLDTWHRSDDLRDAVTLAIVARPGAESTVPKRWRAVSITMPAIDVSSTDLRGRVAAGAPVEYLMPAGALRVLRARNLYTAG